ncbi:hypothetical protein Ancab_012329 [Ancistrocladus abbreviatus]
MPDFNDDRYSNQAGLGQSHRKETAGLNSGKSRMAGASASGQKDGIGRIVEGDTRPTFQRPIFELDRCEQSLNEERASEPKVGDCTISHLGGIRPKKLGQHAANLGA